MTDRHITIESPAKLTLRDEQLVIHLPDGEVETAPIEDIASLMIESQEASISVPALNALTGNNVAVAFCDARHTPVSMLVALHANTVQTERFRAQLTLTEESKDELWRQIVSKKINKQADLLDLLSKDGKTVRRFAEDILPGDTANREGSAAREYWKLLFGEKFTRDRFGDGPNPLLNYGYAILRSTVARALLSTGLNPCLGLHHCNRYDDLCLADDIMEPYRPAIDLKVFELWTGGARTVNQEAKVALREIVLNEYTVKGFRHSLLNAVGMTASSLLDCIKKEKRVILYPD